MLKIVPKTSFKAKVPLSIPGNDRLAVVTLEFKHLNKKAMKDFFTGLEGKTDAEALSEVLLGWEDIDAPFSRTRWRPCSNTTQPPPAKSSRPTARSCWRAAEKTDGSR